jgi:hypothetical protein
MVGARRSRRAQAGIPQVTKAPSVDSRAGLAFLGIDPKPHAKLISQGSKASLDHAEVARRNVTR